MIARSRSSTRCAGAIGPRPAGWSWLRNAWDSYHFAAHSVNSLDFSRGIADVQPMPRTPLLRALRRLADEHRAADHLGIPPAELRGQQAEAAASYTRGELLKRGAIAGAGAVAGSAFPAERAKSATAPRIAIVGGGIAGLNAALTLADKGVPATIYEAATRIGGRMHSNTSGYWNDAQVTEWCGELIDTNHKTIRALAQRFKFPLADTYAGYLNGSTDTYWFTNY